jgi:hypothetical protein
VDPATDFAKFCRALEAFQAGLSSAQVRTGDDSLRQELGALGERLSTGRAQLAAEYRAAAAAVDQQIAQAKQQAQQTLEKLAQIREQLAAPQAELPATPVAPSEPDPVDPKLGQVLRRELLRRFRWMPEQNGSNRRNGGADREIWEGWDDI